MSSEKAITISEVNPHLIKAQYAVRGQIVVRAAEIEKEIKEGKKYPFDSLIYCNIGNPHQLRQKPITFIRQVLSLVTYPELVDLVPEGTFPADVVERAKKLRDANPGGSGAYSASKGIPLVCQDVADFISRRDGYECDVSSVFLTDGASPSVKNALQLITASPEDGFLIPIPQYPLYSAATTINNAKIVGYHLDEENNWGLDMKELEEKYEEAVKQGIRMKGLVVINPGNPTGMCMEESEMQECIRFCVKNKLAILADEVYQENIYVPSKKFVSFRKAALDMGEEAKDVQIFSFHSTSKGFLGECGRRGGYMQIMGFDGPVYDQIVKIWSINICANVDGQVTLDLMVNPPKPGEPSYELYASERKAILDSLARRATRLHDALTKLPGISCQPADGSMYIFFKVVLPEKAVAAAEERGVSANYLYCEELLNATGIVTVPGSGFGQRDGTYHVRTTILPPEDQIDFVVSRIADFQKAFIEKYN